MHVLVYLQPADGSWGAFIPTSITTAPGFNHWPFTNPGRPAQDTRMSARPIWSWHASSPMLQRNLESTSLQSQIAVSSLAVSVLQPRGLAVAAGDSAVMCHQKRRDGGAHRNGAPEHHCMLPVEVHLRRTQKFKRSLAGLPSAHECQHGSGHEGASMEKDTSRSAKASAEYVPSTAAATPQHP